MWSGPCVNSCKGPEAVRVGIWWSRPWAKTSLALLSRCSADGQTDDEIAKAPRNFLTLHDTDLATANAALKAKGMPEIELPEHAPVAWRYSGDPDTRAAQDRD